MPVEPQALPRILLRGVAKQFQPPRRRAPPVQALAGVNLEIADNSFVALLGPSGCGKTTALRLMNGLIVPDEGTVLVDGKPPRPSAEIGFLFQSFRLIPWLNIRDNVAFGLEIQKMPKRERRDLSERYLDLVGLMQFADSYPAELSGGMKQRAALARALATDPSILLMDEPFASIDAQTRETMQTELLRIWTLRKGIIVFVTHSVDEAVLLADRVALMGPRPGHIVEILDVALPRPRDLNASRGDPRFIEQRNYLSDRIRALAS